MTSNDIPQGMKKAINNNKHCHVTGKICFSTKKKALKQVQRSKAFAMKNDVVFASESVYKCRFCDKWHTTKQKDKKSS